MSVIEESTVSVERYAQPLPELRDEHTWRPLRVQGSIPADLRGIFLQNGPARWDGVLASHWFDGVGALRAVRLEKGTARGAVRILHSPSLDADLDGRSRHMAFRDKGGVGVRIAGLFGGSPVRNLANINVLPWEDEYLALMETTPPLRVDPEALELLGETDLGGALEGGLQAHYHRVPDRSATYLIGLRVGPKVKVDLYAFPDGGGPERLTTLELPGVTELHDFAVTRDHAILVLTPFWTSSLNLLWQGSFETSLEWDPEGDVEIVVLSLDDGEVVQRMTTETFWFWHVANAWGEGKRITLDLIRYPDFERSVIWEDPAQPADRPFEPSYARGTLDLEAGTAHWRTLLEEAVEFPKVHPAAETRPHRYTWLGGHPERGPQRGWFDRILCFDTQTGAVERFGAGDRCVISEPVLAPRSEDERDAWTLALVWDLEADASCLAIWEAAEPAEPVARVWFDQAVPPGLHGCWIRATG